MLGGDINLSITMTFLSSLAAFAMTSWWVWALGSRLVQDSLPIPYTQLVIGIQANIIIDKEENKSEKLSSYYYLLLKTIFVWPALVSFAVPLCLGVLARRIRPKLCEKVRERFARPVWLLILLAIVIGGVVLNLFFFYLVRCQTTITMNQSRTTKRKRLVVVKAGQLATPGGRGAAGAGRLHGGGRAGSAGRPRQATGHCSRYRDRNPEWRHCRGGAQPHLPKATPSFDKLKLHMYNGITVS